ncbi:MAG: hypothetical protein QME52_04100 [Bacteroidota bacterium]|nr:hypothetical protein [Bacteroidota bacterium]
MINLKHILSTKNPIHLLLLLGIIFSWDCSNPKNPGSPHGNQLPITRVSNVPKDGDTSQSPRVTLNWVGDDPDGYVVGFKYRWVTKHSQDDPGIFEDYKTILNIIIKKFALLAITENEKLVPSVYKFFATLPPDEGLDKQRTDSLARGDTITIAGVRVYASNPDSIRAQSTGLRVKADFPPHTNPNSGTFIFNSEAKWNNQTFEVTAIDNLGEISRIPARLSFVTPKVNAPKTFLVYGLCPNIKDTLFVLGRTTPTFSGIRFVFKGIDPNSRTIEYRWVCDTAQWRAKVDSIPWSPWSTSEEAYVTASHFPDSIATSHTFYVQARNEFKVIDTVGWYQRYHPDTTRPPEFDSAYCKFNTVYPPFLRSDLPQENKILFINASWTNSIKGSGTPWLPSAAMLDSFYKNIFIGLGFSESQMKFWTVDVDPPNGSFPGNNEIGKYNLVLYYSETVKDPLKDEMNYPPYVDFNESRQRIIRDYCYVGGKAIFTGWCLSTNLNAPNTGSFYERVWHIKSEGNYRSDPILYSEFIGANGLHGYPGLNLDTTKMNSAWLGKIIGTETSRYALRHIWLNYPVGFGEIIHTFKSLNNGIIGYDGRPPRPIILEDTFIKRPLSVRYLGVTFDAVFFGIPLYYMERQSVYSTIEKVLQDFDYKK